MPVDNYATAVTQKWFRSKQEYVPDDLDKLTEPYLKQREIDTVQALLSDIEKDKSQFDDLSAAIWNRPYEQTMDICYRFVNDRSRIMAQVSRDHGDESYPELFIPDCDSTIDERWFAFHHAKSYLALLCLYIHKFGTNRTPESIKDIENTVVDSNYAASLAFAEGLAYNETKGDLGKLCRWMYGVSRKLITIRRLDELMPQNQDIERAAYFRWDTFGKRHGRDRDDWLIGERELCRYLWPVL